VPTSGNGKSCGRTLASDNGHEDKRAFTTALRRTLLHGAKQITPQTVSA